MAVIKELSNQQMKNGNNKDDDGLRDRIAQYDSTLVDYINLIPCEVYYAKDEEALRLVNGVKRAILDKKLNKKSTKAKQRSKKTLNRLAKLDPTVNQALQPASIREAQESGKFVSVPAVGDAPDGQKRQKKHLKVVNIRSMPDNIAKVSNSEANGFEGSASDKTSVNNRPSKISNRLRKRLKKYGLKYNNDDAIEDLKRKLDAKVREMRRNKATPDVQSNGSFEDDSNSQDSSSVSATHRGRRQGSIESLTSSSSNASKVQDANGNLVFSKFDFIKPPTITSSKEEEEKRRKSKPKLKKLSDELRRAALKKEQLERIAKVDPEKGVKLKAEEGWRHALDKSEGIKIKDDPAMINKAIKKIKRIKKKRAQKWAERKKNVHEQMAKRQEKRQSNIKKRAQSKKEAKIKRLKKKGRMIPGF